jgi:hypothetical protein
MHLIEVVFDGIEVVFDEPRAPPPAQLPSSHLALYESQYN